MYDVSIIDFKMGNLKSIKEACNYVGLKSIITNNPKIISSSKCIILPGVGSFPQAMKNLKKLNLIDVIYSFYKSEKLIIGICLGMQLLFEESLELKKTKGLGLIKGQVISLSFNKKKNINIGWKKIFIKKKNACLSNKLNNKRFYFIHKYFCKPHNKSNILAHSEFNEKLFCASIKFKNIEAYQFHPEKSGVNGLKIYNNIKKKINSEKLI